MRPSRGTSRVTSPVRSTIGLTVSWPMPNASWLRPKPLSARIEGTLDRAVALLGRVDEIYRQGGPKIRRLSNQFMFEKLLIREREVAGAVYREPWATLRNEKLIVGLRRNARNPGRRSVGQGSKMIALAPSAGFEPATHGLGNRCSIP